MTPPGGGPDIGELLRGLGRDAVLREAEAAGLKPTRGANPRMRCPFPGCRDKSVGERSASAWVYSGNRGEPRIHCARCNGNGSLVDLLAAVNGWTAAQAIAHLRGLPAPASKPALHLVAPEASPASDKLAPEQVRAIWDALAKDDAAGRAYLEGRGLGDAADTGLVRFATAEHPNTRIKAWARSKRLVVGLLKDVVGQPRGLQGRLVRPLRDGERGKCISLKDTWNKRAFFGAPELIEGAPVVAVAEGLADWLALAGWAGREVVCVGAAGMESLASLAEELARTGISVEGKLFLLFPQNDRPLNKSRAAFDRLGQLLHKAGARVVMQSTPEDTKDVADWLQAHPDAAWPPAAVATALGGEVEHESPATQLVEPVRGSLPIQGRVTVESWENDLASLTAILDDPLHREAVMGRAGELAYNEMSGELAYGGRELDETDITGIRVRILQHLKTPGGKRMKFGPDDVWDALAYLSKRRKVHPLRDWLLSLRHDGAPRLEGFLARAFGLDWPTLEAELLRKWFISAAARGIEPGCKVDTVLVLVGAEGLRKTSFFEMIAGEEYFTSSTVHVGEADGYSLLRHNWVVEWGELDSMRRARDSQAIRNFLSARSDNYRPKWGKGHERVKRSCVIVGTTNEERFFSDEWNRRFWPVRVSSIDFHWLRANREQLWAEAAGVVHAASSCAACAPLLPEQRCDAHRWWLSEAEAAVLRGHNQGFREVNDWVELLREYIDDQHPSKLSANQVLVTVVGKPAGQWVPGKDMAKAVNALQALGWRKGTRRIDGDVGRWWVPPHQFELGEAGE